MRELSSLRDRTGVFADRAEAGAILAGLLADPRRSGAIVLGIPAGGVPVAAAVAERLALPLDVAVVSKITPDWQSEIGYGAVAFDGTVELNEPLIARLGLGADEVRLDIARTLEKVRRRTDALRGGRAPIQAEGRAVVLVDDGLASGFTIRLAARAVRQAGAGRVEAAVPTGNLRAIGRLAGRVEQVYCANVRTGPDFAVADAYRAWRDIDETEAAAILARFEGEGRKRADSAESCNRPHRPGMGVENAGQGS